jgi:60 kDa SS-A/Ro ribonucleoprotein
MVQGSDATRQIVESIADTEWLRKGRIHPAQIFLAKQNASVIPRASVWDAPTRRDPTFPQSVLNALESAFYKSFDNLQGTDKRIMLAIDVSGSMSSSIAGMSVTAAEWAALMAMVTLRQAPHAEVYGFSANFINLGITAYDSMEDVMRKTADKNFGGTNCALPLTYATEQNMKFDAFVVYTDSETYSLGYVPSTLQKYRASSGVQDAKLIISATEANNITIGDGNDPNTLGVCGVSASAPKAIENFMR